MWWGIVTLFPELFSPWCQLGVIGRACTTGKVMFEFENPRQYAQDPHQTVDDRPYGGGPGMILKAAPLDAAIQALKQKAPSEPKVIFLSPGGQCFNQKKAELVQKDQSFILIAGRYEGIDQRVLDKQVDESWSIGDYVLSGGEIPAMAVMETIVRLQPGVLGDPESALKESFSKEQKGLEHPHYTRPPIWDNQAVPDVLLSGDHQAIARWRTQIAKRITGEKRPDLLKDFRGDMQHE